jgi:uncharacterized protein (TIGR02145 family)
MVDIRGFNGGLNMDSSDELLPNGDYKYAMNINNGDAGITKLLGNNLIEGFPENDRVGGEWVCGSFLDKKRNRIIFFTNHERSAHRILSYELPSVNNPNGQFIVLFREDVTQDNGGFVFGWDRYPQYNPNALIKDIKVVHREMEGDLYYFVDPKKRLLKFNYNTLLRYTSGDANLCEFGWTKANYDGTTFRNGDPIPEVTDRATWASLTTPAWCYYNNNAANNSTYGKLYNWYAINDPRGFAPLGYRVPTKNDWETLISCLGGPNVAGGKLKGTLNWEAPNTGATNESLFKAIGGGYRLHTVIYDFYLLDVAAFFWTSTEFDANEAFDISLNNSSAIALIGNYNKTEGRSVRLIKEV